MTHSDVRTFRVGLALVLIVLTINAGLSYWSIRRIAGDDRRVARTHEVLEAISHSLSALRDAENGQRGDIITGETTYRVPYQAAVVAARDGLGRLGRLIADDPGQRTRLEAIRAHVERRLALLAECLRVRDAEGFEAARTLIREGRGRREMEEVRALFAAMEAEEERLLRDRDASSRRAYATALLTDVVSTAASLGLIGMIYMMAGRTIAARARARALQEADRRKDEFLATLAHELRNPLYAIRAALDSLRLDGRDDPAIRRPGELIDRQVEHISRLIEDLLDASRIARGKLGLRRGPMDLAGALDLAVEIGRPLIDARAQRLIVERGPSPMMVEGDRTRLAQVVANLLGNAAKYSDRGGRIWLEAAREGGQAAVRVRDEGRGIAPEMLPDLFGLYAQEQRVRDLAQGGLGIGLSLVQRLVEMHGGTIAARSEGPGRGSEFIVRLPLSEASPASPDGDGRPEPAAAATRPPDRPRRVLLVDDNADVVEMYAIMLGARGYEVQVAHDGPAAIEAARAFRPDVVLTDISLPALDGFAVAERLRSQPETSDVLLIAMSGSAREEDRRRALEIGFDDYLTKPVRFARVEELLSAPRRPHPASR